MALARVSVERTSPRLLRQSAVTGSVAEGLKKGSGSKWLACRAYSSHDDIELADVFSGRWW
jgi:hypothetical protein